MLSTVVVTSTLENNQPIGASSHGEGELASQRVRTSDSTRLLEDVPGVSVYSAGGISGLPVIRGLADDRLRVQVDGMDLMSACPNHMNSVLSYIDPSRVASIDVYAGISPVSTGGDSIGGSIQMKSAPLKFARVGESLLFEGQIGAFYRSNGHARGYNFGASVAGEQAALSYAESNSQSDNYEAAGPFKLPGLPNDFGRISPNEVAASEYSGARNRTLDLALRRSDHLVELGLSEQRIDYEGFPNQRMDMVTLSSTLNPTLPVNYLIDEGEPANVNRLANLRYTGQYGWGVLEGQVFRQRVQHHMDMLPHRNGTMIMPMDTKSTTWGGLLKASIELTETDTVRLGSDFQRYRLDDWWPPIGGPLPGAMCCDDFRNIRDGERDRLGLFAEWETRWTPEWLTLAGLRSDSVRADAGPVQGYSSIPSYQIDADRFNALDRESVDHIWDWTLLTRFSADALQTYEAGIARKTRSPNLYERYPWSTFAMAALMNNFVGDGNGYVGNPDLKPEVAHTVSASADWHDASQEEWGLRFNAYATWVEDFIDAKRCGPPVCSTTSYLTATNAYVLLQYVNQSARLYGFDLSGHRHLGKTGNWGDWSATALVNYIRGENRSTGDNLYHMMPLNAKLTLVHRLGGWTNTAEAQGVAAKTRISQVRNEVTTPGYALFNLRSSYEWKQARLDLEIENVFDTFYLLPLGGAYLGQGNSMTTGGVPWGMSVPGRGRSFNAALNISF